MRTALSIVLLGLCSCVVLAADAPGAATIFKEDGVLVLTQVAGQPLEITLKDYDHDRLLSDDQFKDPDALAVQEALGKPGMPLDPGLYHIKLSAPPSEAQGQLNVTIVRVELNPKARKRSILLYVSEPLRAHGSLTVGSMKYWSRQDLGGPQEKHSAPQTIPFDINVYKAQPARWLISVAPHVGGLLGGGSGAPSVDLSVRSGARFTQHGGEGFSMQDFSLTGDIPLTRPSDVPAGTSADASPSVADYIEAAYNIRSWHAHSQSVDVKRLVARTTGRLRGLEVAGQYQPWASFGDDGRTFSALGVEAGWRARDNQEWHDATTPAPARGHALARALAVAEWAPQIGPVNRNLSEGMRFFVRGRGWADYAKDDSGSNGVRCRGFFDTELFWNISTEQRLFFRYEAGCLPPDLSKHVQRFSVGIGKAF
jgi:hypothetical protein